MTKTLERILDSGLKGNGNGLSVYDEKRRFTFNELESASTRISYYYRVIGCKKGDRIAIAVLKSPNVLPFILACWKAGCIYVPLDPTAPSDRLKYLLNDIQPTVVIGMSKSHEIEKLTKSIQQCTYLGLDDLYNEDNALVFENDPCRHFEEVTIEADDPAYCIYTSGSTGNPKGVLISHASCVSFFESVQEFMQIDRESRCLSLGPLIFDVSVIDLFFPLYMGVSVYVYSLTIIPTLFGKIVRHKKISHFAAPAPVLSLLAKDKQHSSTYDFQSVKVIMTGADILDSETIYNLFLINNNLKIINGYGPTEATCVCTAFIIDSNYEKNNQLFPIGKPLNGVETVLVDKDMNSVTGDEPGELLVAGRQLLIGYWNNESESDNRIIYINDKKYYKTGDLAKYDDNGNMIFLGRLDEEVKISGIRIHLNEIRYALMKLAGIKEVVVTVSNIEGKKSIIAAVEKKSSYLLTVDSILLQLKDCLPKYMIPKVVKIFDEFPTLPSGKLNKNSIIKTITV